MGRRTKRMLLIFIPLILVLVIGLGIVLPTSLADNSSPLQINDGLAEKSGAEMSSAAYKGGAIFLAPNTTFNMQGGTISGHSNKYGGAIYISEGATFTMSGGTIKENTADYGGAIYVARGGKCIINGGSIKQNSAKVAPGIYVESGASLEVADPSFITDNVIIEGEPQPEGHRVGWFCEYDADTFISSDDGWAQTYLGREGELYLKTINFGSYPQDYVGDGMNEKIEQWYQSKSPQSVGTYTIRTKTWSAYIYQDGKTYVRGESYPYSTDPCELSDLGLVYNIEYRDGSLVKENGEIVWFEVQPISWLILNYDKWQSGQEKLEVISEIVLTSDIPFNESSGNGNDWETSYIRNWLNDEFYNSAFTAAEKQQIIKKELKNNKTGEYNKDPSTWTGTTTQDNVWLPSYYDLMTTKILGWVKMEMDEPGNYEEYSCGGASLSDFAISNYCCFDPYFTCNYRLGMAEYWWLRSAGYLSDLACFVNFYGGVNGR